MEKASERGILFTSIVILPPPLTPLSHLFLKHCLTCLKLYLASNHTPSPPLQPLTL